MRPLDELLSNDPAWPLVQDWIADATNPVEVLPPDLNARDDVLHQTQVTTRSPMGAIIYETGGILIDHGWLRILGSGHPRLPRSQLAWNQAVGQDGLWLVADDVLGGFFALNGGAFPTAPGAIHYYSPDSHEWEDYEGGYSDFLVWCIEGDLAKFYGDYRWPGWEAEVAALSGDQGLLIYPFLSIEGPPIGDRHRGPVPMHELYSAHGPARDG